MTDIKEEPSVEGQVADQSDSDSFSSQKDSLTESYRKRSFQDVFDSDSFKYYSEHQHDVICPFQVCRTHCIVPFDQVTRPWITDF
jgi:hypothetical protein